MASDPVRFLGLQEPDFRLLERHAPLLAADAEDLAQALLDYLLARPETAPVLQEYPRARIEALTRRQAEHACELLHSRLDDGWCARMRKLGRRHYDLGVRPAWIAGAYLIYWRHWTALVETRVAAEERTALRDVLLRLLLGDLMAQLEGYAAQVRRTDTQRLAVARVLLEVMAHPIPEDGHPLELLNRICQGLVRNVDAVALSAYVLSETDAQRPAPLIAPDCQAGIEVPGLRLPGTVEEPAVIPVEDRHAPEWTAPLRGRVREVALFPFGQGRMCGVGMLASTEEGYFQRVGAAFFLGFSHLGSLVLHLREWALRDPLTGLPNRALFSDRLAHERTRAWRLHRLLAIGILDLDGFKEINDRLGHGAGDELLVAMGARLEALLRDGDTLVRMGGDEFGLLLPELHDVAELEGICTRLLEALPAPVPVADGEWVSVSASLGVTLFPFDEVEADSLLRHADEALYAAKHGGKNQYRLYSTEFDAAVRRQAHMHDILAAALAEGRLLLHYQPIVDLDGTVLGFEALLRMRTEDGHIVGPETFFAALDHPHLARPIGRFVLQASVAQAAAWTGAGHGWQIHVNIAASHLLDPRFLADVEEAWGDARVPGPHQGTGGKCTLVVEISESAPLADLDRAAHVLHELGARGIEVALDDLGTGHASLQYLQRLPAATIKIDRNFVRDIPSDSKDFAIVAGVVVTAQILGLRVVAEGVESATHAGLLARLGCHYLQGYWIARPMPAEHVTEWATAFRPPALPDADPAVESAVALPHGLVLEGHAGRVRRFVEALRRGGKLPDEVIEPGAERRCLLGRWLDLEGRRHLPSKPVYDALAALHVRLHEHARAAVAARAAGGDAAAPERHLHLLEVENRALLGILHGLLLETEPAPSDATADAVGAHDPG
jgi:diguanylate cyclase (GGDEF)-like protein